MSKKHIFMNNLRLKRLELGITQTQLADITGISRNSISSIETGQYNPTAYTAALLCEALQCNFHDLFWIYISE